MELVHNNQRRSLKSILYVLSVVVGFLLAPAVTEAATLFYSPASRTYTVGERFSVSAVIESETQAMNAVAADISFPQNLLELTSISQSGSVVGFWVQEPGYSNQSGTAYFEGVVLNGYQGTAGRLVTLNFRARAVGTATVRFSSGTILANDGLGSTLPAGLGTATFTIRAAPERAESTTTAFDIPEFIPEDYRFNTDLRAPQTDLEVAYLQLCLQAERIYGAGITGTFDTNTRNAVIAFQEKYAQDILDPWGFARGTGLVSETTRQKLNQVCSFGPPVDELTKTFEALPVSEPEKISFFKDIWFWISLAIVLAVLNMILLIILIQLLYRKKQTPDSLRVIAKRLETVEQHQQLTSDEIKLIKRLRKDLEQLENKVQHDKKRKKV